MSTLHCICTVVLLPAWGMCALKKKLLGLRLIVECLNTVHHRLMVVCLLVSRPASSSTTTGTLPSHFYSRWRRQQQELDSESDSIESIYKTLSAPHVRTRAILVTHTTLLAKAR